VRDLRRLSIDSVDLALPKGSAMRDIARETAFRFRMLDLIRNVRNPFGRNRDQQYQTWLKWNAKRSRPTRNSGGTHPFFSIIIAGRVAQATLQSLTRQTYSSWEAILQTAPSNVGRIQQTSKVRVIKGSETEPPSLQQCLSAVRGDYFMLMFGGDTLTDDALQVVAEFISKKPRMDVVYTDSDQIGPNGLRVRPFFKPDWSPRLIKEMNYVGLSCFFRTKLARSLRTTYEEPWPAAYDLLLSVARRSKRIGHVAKPLYSVTGAHGYYKHAISRPDSNGQPLVTIIIITHDRVDLLRKCIRSIEQKTTYKNLEIMIIDRDSRDSRTRQYLSSLTYNVIEYRGSFNFSRINNFAARYARGNFLVFMNDDVEVLEPQWIQAMLREAQSGAHVGMVGPLLLYPNGTIQHSGVVVGVGIISSHIFRYMNPDNENYWSLHAVPRECSAVTAACAMIRKSTFNEVGGFDERLVVDFNDVDICLRLRKKGYATIYTPRARLIHRESSTRGHREHLASDQAFFAKRWQKYLRDGDPFYNNNLTMIWENAAIGPIGHEHAAISLLLEIFAMRKDLQTRFPEAADGVHVNGLVRWAVGEGITEKMASRYLLPRLQTFRNFLKT